MAFRTCCKSHQYPRIFDNRDHLQENRDDSNAEGDDREGGLGWLKAVVTSDKKVAATPRAVVMVHKNADELRSAQGTQDASART